MPKVIVPLADTDETVVRPVILSVIDQMLKYTELTKEDVQIFYPGTENKTFQPNSSINTNGTPNQLKGAFYNQVSIEVDEQYEHDRILATAVFHPENLFIFRDDYLETSIRPVYASSEVSINIRFRSRDKNTAIRWRDQMRTRISRGRMTHLHTLDYSYFIPDTYMAILKQIHQMREAVAGYGQDFDTYFRETVTPKATLLSDLAGKNTAWTIAESQMRVVGYFDYDGAPEPGGREDGGETWTIAVTYKFKYDKPAGAVMFYPLMIHNQLMPQEFRPEKGPYEVIDQQRAYAWSTKNLAHFEMGNRVKRYSDNDGVCIPVFDEFIPSQAQLPSPTARIVTALVAIDPNNPRWLMNLASNLDPYELDPEIVAFMQGEAPYMTVMFNSIFNLALFENENICDPSYISADSSLNVTAMKPLSYRHYYHLRLSILTNPNLLNPAAKKRMRGNCGAAVKIFDMLDPTLKVKNQLPVCLPGNWLPNDGWCTTTGILTNPVTATGNGQTYGVMKTVNTLSILALRQGATNASN